MEPETLNMKHETKFVFSKESLKKKFRWSEFLAEKIITFVAFLSIAIIVLIFIFVFRETLPIFRTPKSIHNQQLANNLQQVISLRDTEKVRPPTSDLKDTE